MIIVTGCDNTGKTSLVNYLSKKLDMPLAERFPNSPPKSEIEWMSWSQYVLGAFEDQTDKIYDRLLIDELVYGPVCRGKISIPIYLMSQLCSMMLVRQPIYIYTSVPYSVVSDTYSQREQYPKLQQVNEILNKFREVNNSWPVKMLSHIYSFDFTRDPNYESITRYLQCVMNK